MPKPVGGYSGHGFHNYPHARFGHAGIPKGTGAASIMDPPATAHWAASRPLIYGSRRFALACRMTAGSPAYRASAAANSS